MLPIHTIHPQNCIYSGDCGSWMVVCHGCVCLCLDGVGCCCCYYYCYCCDDHYVELCYYHCYCYCYDLLLSTQNLRRFVSPMLLLWQLVHWHCKVSSWERIREKQGKIIILEKSVDMSKGFSISNSPVMILQLGKHRTSQKMKKRGKDG